MKKDSRCGFPVRCGRWCGALLLALALPGMLAADSPASDELVISGSEWITDAPTWLAAAAGYFNADTGPRIRVELADSGKQALERLMAGEADFALMAAVPLAMTLTRLHHEGVPQATWPVVLASVGLSSRTHHVIADARRGIEQPTELAGHGLGLLLDTSAHYGWDRFADLQGIGAGAVRLLNSRPDELAAGLAAGNFDAVVAWSPFSEQILDQLGPAARRFSLQAMDSVDWLLVCRRTLIARHPHAVDRVLRGYAEAIELLQTELERAAALLDLSPDKLRDNRMVWKLALNWSVIANMEAKLEWSANRLDMPPLRVSPRIYIERGPLEQYRPRAVSLPTWIAAGQAER